MIGQTPDEITQQLAERLCWEVARRDDAQVARRLYRKQLEGNPPQCHANVARFAQ